MSQFWADLDFADVTLVNENEAPKMELNQIGFFSMDGLFLGGFVKYFIFHIDEPILGGFGVCSTLQCSVKMSSVIQCLMLCIIW